MKKYFVFIIAFISINSYSQEIQKMDETGNIIHAKDNGNYVIGELIIKFKENTINEDFVQSTPSTKSFQVNEIKKKSIKKIKH